MTNNKQKQNKGGKPLAKKGSSTRPYNAQILPSISASDFESLEKGKLIQVRDVPSGVEVDPLCFRDKKEGREACDKKEYTLDLSRCIRRHELTNGTRDVGMENAVNRVFWSQPFTRQDPSTKVRYADSRGNMIGYKRTEVKITNLCEAPLNMKATTCSSREAIMDNVDLRTAIVDTISPDKGKKDQALMQGESCMWTVRDAPHNYQTMDGNNRIQHITDFLLILPDNLPDSMTTITSMVETTSIGEAVMTKEVDNPESEVAQVEIFTYYDVLENMEPYTIEGAQDEYRVNFVAEYETLVSIDDTQNAYRILSGGAQQLSREEPGEMVGPTLRGGERNYTMIDLSLLGFRSFGVDMNDAGYAYLALFSGEEPIGEAGIPFTADQLRAECIILPFSAGYCYDESGDDMGFGNGTFRWDEELSKYVLWDFMTGTRVPLPPGYGPDNPKWHRRVGVFPSKFYLESIPLNPSQKERLVPLCRQFPRDSEGAISWALLLSAISFTIKVLSVTRSVIQEARKTWG